MRRTALTLLAALGFASLAAAAAHDWTSVSEIEGYLGSIEDLAQGSFTVAVLFDDTLPYFEMKNTRPSQSGGMIDRAQFSFSTWDDYGSLWWNASVETYIDPDTDFTEEVGYLTQAETYLLGISVQRTTNGCDLAFSVNGTHLATLSANSTWAELFFSDDYFNLIQDTGETSDHLFVLDGEALSAGDIADSVDAYLNPTTDPDVPEPTALVLLALGVGALALRRRV